MVRVESAREQLRRTNREQRHLHGREALRLVERDARERGREFARAPAAHVQVLADRDDTGLQADRLCEVVHGEPAQLLARDGMHGFGRIRIRAAATDHRDGLELADDALGSFGARLADAGVGRRGG